MRLVKIDKTYFNPEMVTAVSEAHQEGRTYVWVAAGCPDDEGLYFTVKCPVEDVVSLLACP